MLIRHLAGPRILRPSGLLCKRCTVIAPSWTRQTRPFTSSPPRSALGPLQHRLKILGTEAQDAKVKAEGIPGLYSPQAFTIAYTDYQKMLLDRLNNMVTGTAFSDNNVLNIVLLSARQPEMASLFNYASMLWNNHFYFDNVSSGPTSMPSNIESQIAQSFGSVSAFKDTYIATARAMFGPGFVWLVQEKTGQRNLKILSTYLAGSPHPGAHWRRQTIDTNSLPPPHTGDGNDSGNGNAGSFGNYSKNQPPPQPNKPNAGAADITPLLCVSTWEHTWLPQFGITGKEDFLHAWYERVNWEKVDGMLQDRNNTAGIIQSLAGTNSQRRRTHTRYDLPTASYE